MNGFNLQQVKKNLMRTQREIPLRLAKMTEKHFAESFSKGALDEYKWKEVQRRIEGTPSWKYKKKGISLNTQRTAPILVQTGNLRRKVNRSIHSIKPNEIRLVVDLPYAKIHNEGGMAGRNHASAIPARPFMKQTKVLTQMQTDLIKKQMDLIWRGQ